MAMVFSSTCQEIRGYRTILKNSSSTLFLNIDQKCSLKLTIIILGAPPEGTSPIIDANCTVIEKRQKLTEKIIPRRTLTYYTFQLVSGNVLCLQKSIII